MRKQNSDISARSCARCACGVDIAQRGIVVRIVLGLRLAAAPHVLERAPFEIAAGGTWIALYALLAALARNAKVRTHVNVLQRRAAMVMAVMGALFVMLAAARDDSEEL